MQKKRLTGDPGAIYHVRVSFLDAYPALAEAQLRRKMNSILRRYETFTDCELLTYCFLPLQYNLLIRVPEVPVLSEEAILARLKLVRGKVQNDMLERRLKRFKEMDADHLLEEELHQLRQRFGSLSHYMKDTKQCFSQFYNKWKRRRGPLYEERYEAALVESGEPALQVASFIDALPVLCRIDAKQDEPISGFHSAKNGDRPSRQGLRKLHEAATGKPIRWATIESGYGQRVNQHLEYSAADADTERTYRFYTSSLALGSEPFVLKIMAEQPDKFGKHPKTVAGPFGLFGAVTFRRSADAIPRCPYQP